MDEDLIEGSEPCVGGVDTAVLVLTCLMPRRYASIEEGVRHQVSWDKLCDLNNRGFRKNGPAVLVHRIIHPRATGTSEQVVKDIRRATRKQYSAEEKIRIVLDGLARRILHC